jgi:hypothetical protein
MPGRFGLLVVLGLLAPGLLAPGLLVPFGGFVGSWMVLVSLGCTSV